MSTAVETKDLVKTFGHDIHAVRGVDLRIEPGELMVLVGPSGCGKTTTLRMIAGLERVTSGEIYVGDQLVNTVHPSKRGVALVFQNFALYPHKTARENMAFPLESEKVDKAEITRRVDEVAEMLELNEHLNKTPLELSGGQQQRVSLGRAVVRNPQVLLLDEPLSNLDARLRVVMRSELKRIQRAVGSTSIYVTHDQVEAMTMGDRIVVMHEGLVAQIGTPQEVYLTPANLPVARTIGSPAMNLIEATPKVEDGQVRLDGAGWSLGIAGDGAGYLGEQLDQLTGDQVVVGVRPEDLDFDDPAGEVSTNTARLANVQCVTAEPLGSETLYNVDLDGFLLQLLRRDTHVMLTEGHNADLHVANGGRVYVFDATSGDRIAGLHLLTDGAGQPFWQPFATADRAAMLEGSSGTGSPTGA